MTQPSSFFGQRCTTWSATTFVLCGVAIQPGILGSPAQHFFEHQTFSSKGLMSSDVVLGTAGVASEAALLEAALPESPDAPARVAAQPSSRSGGGWRCCMRPDRCA